MDFLVVSQYNVTVYLKLENACTITVNSMLIQLHDQKLDIWVHIHKYLRRTYISSPYTNLRSCFNLRFQIEEFVGALRCKIYILNEKALNLSLTQEFVHWLEM